MLADNFWFSLEVAGCQKTDWPPGTQLPTFVCRKRTLYNLGMPQTACQLEPVLCCTLGPISALTPALRLPLKLRALVLCGL